MVVPRQAAIASANVSRVRALVGFARVLRLLKVPCAAPFEFNGDNQTTSPDPVTLPQALLSGGSAEMIDLEAPQVERPSTVR